MAEVPDYTVRWAMNEFHTVAGVNREVPKEFTEDLQDQSITPDTVETLSDGSVVVYFDNKDLERKGIAPLDLIVGTVVRPLHRYGRVAYDPTMLLVPENGSLFTDDHRS
jgi:hypothetical protein